MRLWTILTRMTVLVLVLAGTAAAGPQEDALAAKAAAQAESDAMWVLHGTAEMRLNLAHNYYNTVWIPEHGRITAFDDLFILANGAFGSAGQEREAGDDDFHDADFQMVMANMMLSYNYLEGAVVAWNAAETLYGYAEGHYSEAGSWYAACISISELLLDYMGCPGY